MNERFSRCLVLVVADFNRSAAEVLALRDLGARVLVAGLGTKSVRKLLEEHGVDTAAVGRSKKDIPDVATWMSGGCDAVFFAAGDWKAAVEAVRDAEQQSAIADGRRMIPILEWGDRRYRFLRTPEQWAAFTLARAAGADMESAKEFARRQRRGHEKKDSDAGRGRRDRGPASAKRRHAQSSDRPL